MRLFPGANINKIKTAVFLAGIFFLAAGSPAMAQQEPTPAPITMPVTGQKAVDRNSFQQGMGMAAALQQQGQNVAATAAEQQRALLMPGLATAPGVAPKKEEVDLGSATDPSSPRYKSERLAKKAKQQREDLAAAKKDEATGEFLPPPEMDSLQQINEARAGEASSIADDPVNKGIALDMRKDAQKEAALSYGARGGLAKRNYQIMESMRGFDTTLDKVFDFRQLLIKAPSGLLIEPPIVKESDDALVITEGGNEAAVADKVFDINKKAKIVSAPRDWRQYLIQTWNDVPPPPRILWPKSPQEQADWNGWVSQGWKAGFDQAEQIFESNTNRLLADYRGMVRYRMLLAQGMISEPYAMHEDRGVTGDRNQMRVGDRALRITSPSQFLTGAELWKPADR